MCCVLEQNGSNSKEYETPVLIDSYQFLAKMLVKSNTATGQE